MVKYITLILLTFSSGYGFEYYLKPQKIEEGIYCFFGKTENISKQKCWEHGKYLFCSNRSGDCYLFPRNRGTLEAG